MLSSSVFFFSFSNTLTLTKIASVSPLQEASSAIPLFSPVLVPMAQSIGPILSQITSSPSVRLGVRTYSPMTITCTPTCLYVDGSCRMIIVWMMMCWFDEIFWTEVTEMYKDNESTRTLRVNQIKYCLAHLIGCQITLLVEWYFYWPWHYDFINKTKDNFTTTSALPIIEEKESRVIRSCLPTMEWRTQIRLFDSYT